MVVGMKALPKLVPAILKIHFRSERVSERKKLTAPPPLTLPET